MDSMVLSNEEKNVVTEKRKIESRSITDTEIKNDDETKRKRQKIETKVKVTTENTSILGNIPIGFIGGGQMASAMIKGLISSNVVTSAQLFCSDRAQKQLEPLSKLGVNTSLDNEVTFQSADIIVLAVKPGIVPIVLKQCQQDLSNKLIISIAAGVTISTIEEMAHGARVVRVMPNTPCLVGCLASAFSLGSNAQRNDADIVCTLLSTLGVTHELPEKQIDAVTGLSGSGPAYVFMFIEALADGGVKSGLSRNVALSLATQTVLGGAKMLMETGKHPGQLKDAVASPGGTTIAGIHQLEKGCFRGTVMNAVVAATNRSYELGKK